MSAPQLEPLEVLLDRAAGPDLEPGLPAVLRELYGGDLVFPRPAGRPYVVANFVSTLDGVVTYSRTGDESGGGQISGFNRQDAFVMGLLRASADAVMVGAATLHGHPGHVRTPAGIFPEAADLYAELRSKLRKRSAEPLNVVVSGSGRVDTDEATFHTPGLEAVIITSEAGAARLREGDGPRVHIAGPEPSLAASAILRTLYEQLGVRLLLHEGGPNVFGSFLADGLVDELFLTLSPRIAGRIAENPRPGLVEGSAFTPDTSPRFELLSLRRSGDFLFERWRRS